MTTLEAPQPSLLDALRAVAPERIALECGATTLTYGALLDAIDDLARGLRAAGVVPGDRVALLLEDGPAHPLALLASWAAGAVAVPIDPRAGTGRRARLLAAADARLALLAAEGEPPEGVPSARLHATDASRPARLEVLERDASAPPSLPAPAPGSAVIRFTSGSTGAPKGVLLDHAAQLFTARTLAQVFGIGPGHRELIAAPLVHSGAWQRAAATLLAGGTLLLPEVEPRLLAASLHEALAERRAHGFYAPPPLVRFLLRLPEARARSALAGCRSIEIGSAPLAPSELTALLALAPGARVFVHYGLTECPRAALLDARAHPEKRSSAGCAAPHAELGVRAADGEALPPESEGEIHVRGPQQALGYWCGAEPGLAASAPGWIATGDLGRLDAEGFLTVHGRRDDRIGAGGHSFFPAEVEHELADAPGVAELLVAGVPDPRGMQGEVPWAFVVPREPGHFRAGELLALARRRLPPYMVPRRVIAVPELPRSGPGKPDRRRTVALHAGAETEAED